MGKPHWEFQRLPPHWIFSDDSNCSRNCKFCPCQKKFKGYFELSSRPHQASQPNEGVKLPRSWTKHYKHIWWRWWNLLAWVPIFITKLFIYKSLGQSAYLHYKVLCIQVYLWGDQATFVMEQLFTNMQNMCNIFCICEGKSSTTTYSLYQ